MGWNSSNTTVVNTPPPKTPEEIEADRIRLEEMRRQNELLAQLMPGQLANIQLQNKLIEAQLANLPNLQEYQRQQLVLAQAQLANAIAEEAMRKELHPHQLKLLQSQAALALEQADALKETTLFQREANKLILEDLRDRALRLEARRKFYSPEEEARAAAEEARRAERMGAMSEEFAKIQLEAARRGTKPTEEQLANINESIDAAQAQGESDIKRFLQETLRQINEETAQAAGLRPTDTPVVRLSERAGEEAARAQGDLASKMAETRATARLNYPLAANKLESDIASQGMRLTAGASSFQQELRERAMANRDATFGITPSLGFSMPQTAPSGPAAMMPLNLNPSAFGFNFFRGGGTQTTNANQSLMQALGGGQGIGQMASGIGAAIGALAVFSDERLKTDVERVGETDAGVPIYTYRYKGDPVPRLGVMAQEAERLFPDAVVEHPSGYLMVDYSKVH